LEGSDDTRTYSLDPSAELNKRFSNYVLLQELNQRHAVGPIKSAINDIDHTWQRPSSYHYNIDMEEIDMEGTDFYCSVRVLIDFIMKTFYTSD